MAETSTADAIVVIAYLLKEAFALWSKTKTSAEDIPEWDELAAKNKLLQDKIDEEMN